MIPLDVPLALCRVNVVETEPETVVVVLYPAVGYTTSTSPLEVPLAVVRVIVVDAEPETSVVVL